MLAEIRSEPDSLARLVSPLLRANVLDRLGRSERASKERQRFTAAVDHLRERLEAELEQDPANSSNKRTSRPRKRVLPI